MKATFENTVDILVRAFINGTLAHGDCAACAVGNIIADNIGAQIVEIEEVGRGGAGWLRKRDGYPLTIGWSDVFCTRDNHQIINPKNYIGPIKAQIDASGYHWKELAKIEAAFESAHNPDHNVDEYGDYKNALDVDWMFNGLMAVVDVLAEIHNIDLTAKESAKKLFVKP